MWSFGIGKRSAPQASKTAHGDADPIPKSGVSTGSKVNSLTKGTFVVVPAVVVVPSGRQSVERNTGKRWECRGCDNSAVVKRVALRRSMWEKQLKNECVIAASHRSTGENYSRTGAAGAPQFFIFPIYRAKHKYAYILILKKNLEELNPVFEHENVDGKKKTTE